MSEIAEIGVIAGTGTGITGRGTGVAATGITIVGLTAGSFTVVGVPTIGFTNFDGSPVGFWTVNDPPQRLSTKLTGDVGGTTGTRSLFTTNRVILNLDDGGDLNCQLSSLVTATGGIAVIADDVVAAVAAVPSIGAP